VADPDELAGVVVIGRPSQEGVQLLGHEMQPQRPLTALDPIVAEAAGV
jgi:hypothetical protein